MKKLFSAMLASFKKDGKALRELTQLADLQVNDYIKLNDSFALPVEIRGKTFQVASIDSYFYADRLSTEWTLKGDTQKKLYLSLDDVGGEDQIVLSYQLNKKEVEKIFGWNAVQAQTDAACQQVLPCKDKHVLEGWLTDNYHRRECAGSATYFAKDYRGKDQPAKGETLSYYSFYDDEENFGLNVEVWSEDEIDVFISLLRPESDIHEFWPS